MTPVPTAARVDALLAVLDEDIRHAVLEEVSLLRVDDLHPLGIEDTETLAFPHLGRTEMYDAAEMQGEYCWFVKRIG